MQLLDEVSGPKSPLSPPHHAAFLISQEEKLQENMADSVKAAVQRGLGLRRGLLIALEAMCVTLREPFQTAVENGSWLMHRVFWVCSE